MPIDVEVNLAIPRIKNPVKDENGYPIDNGTIRFTKRMTVPALPKPGELLKLATSAGHEFDCTITRADWHEELAMFVLSCKYANRSIPADHCAALFSDLEWRKKPLLE
jgi:hypothetical protein